jgi:hypothetical protein
MRNAYSILVGNAEGKRSLGIPRCRWEDNIRMDLWEIGWDGVGWIHLAPNKLPVAGPCEHSNELSYSIKCKEFQD